MKKIWNIENYGIILEIFRKMDPEIDMENVKMKEETRNMLRGNGFENLKF